MPRHAGEAFGVQQVAAFEIDHAAALLPGMLTWSGGDGASGRV
jgi:hypothetical protein